MPDGKRTRADVLDFIEWCYICSDIRKHGHALPVDADRDTIEDGLTENQRIHRNAERAAAALTILSGSGNTPSDSEPA